MAKTSEFSGQLNNLRGVVKIPPYQQIVTPGVRLQTSPYSMNTQMSDSSQHGNIAVPNLGKSSNILNPVAQSAVSDINYTIIQSTSSTPLSEAQKVILNAQHTLIKNAEREH